MSKADLAERFGVTPARIGQIIRSEIAQSTPHMTMDTSNGVTEETLSTRLTPLVKRVDNRGVSKTPTRSTL